jgi:hypothetical protein
MPGNQGFFVVGVGVLLALTLDQCPPVVGSSINETAAAYQVKTFFVFAKTGFFGPAAKKTKYLCQFFFSNLIKKIRWRPCHDVRHA